MKVLLRGVLFLDAVLNLLLGLLLLLSPSATLYSALQLPQPQPAFYGQLLGVAPVGWRLLWQATLNGQLTVAVARTVGQSTAGALIVAVWTLFLDVPCNPPARSGCSPSRWCLPSSRWCRFPQRRKSGCASANSANSAINASRTGTAVRQGRQKEQRRAAARQTQSNEPRREPVITPPPGYGPGTEVMTESAPEETPPAHHARQNPHPDFGSQVTQLIARRVREAHVYCEIHPNDVSDEFVRQYNPKGVILSGSHASTYEDHQLRAPQAVWDLGVPVLGICYGMQTMAVQLGGKVEWSDQREFGYAEVRAHGHTALLKDIGTSPRPRAMACSRSG